MYSLVGILPSFLIRRSAPYKARQYIEAKLQDKIDSLFENGPDTSTLSNMLFAKDAENNERTLTRDQVIENALVLVVAGSETASSTLTLALLLLGLHPDAYQKLTQEQADVLKRYKGQTSITPEQLEDKESPYLDAVVKEALRLGAVSGTFARRVRETFVVDGQQVPKDWFVFPNIRLTHQMDPVTRLPDDSHMDVMKGFSPERWLSPETTPSDFIPFGAGPRYCLGSNLAMMEMKVFLAAFARRVKAFQITGENAEGAVSWNPRTMVPRPADGVPIELGS
jgi:cytochrome P450